MQLYELTIEQAHEKLARKEISAEELTRAFLDRIDKLDSEIGAYLMVTHKEAIEQSHIVDESIAQGGNFPLLAGVPCAIKDNIAVRNIRCSAGSKILENFIAPYDAHVARLLKESGAIILGKTNLDEFAMGSSTENSAYFSTRNPWDRNRVPGGSSGGSAASTAANLCVYALGSDTGGSVRQPASFCGVVGLKPTYGAVSRFGLIAMASSLDQIGPITKTVRDCEIVFNAIRGKDPFDSTSIEQEIQNPKSEIRNLRIGIPKEYFIEGLDPQVKERVWDAVKLFEKSGAQIQEVSLPHSRYALAAYYIIMPAEVSSNLARYDGVRYGKTQDARQGIKDKTLFDVYLRTRQEGFGAEVRRRIMLGTYTLSAGYYDAYYIKAQKVRALIKKDFETVFENVDVIFTPTTPTTAFGFGEKTDDPLSMYLSDIYTVSVNLAGVPAISIPCGKASGLPVGLQIIGNYFQENLLFEAGKWFESNIRT